MYSLHGIYENGKITLLHALPEGLPDPSSVLLTVVDGELGDPGDSDDPSALQTSPGVADENNNEEYYQSIREFQRVKAYGHITVIDRDKQHTFSLNDYSQGGLSFIAKEQFAVGHLISAGITDPSNPELVLMELQMEVRGLFKTDDNQYKIGCMFLDPVDEDLWHGLLQYLS